METIEIIIGALIIVGFIVFAIKTCVDIFTKW